MKEKTIAETTITSLGVNFAKFLRDVTQVVLKNE